MLGGDENYFTIDISNSILENEWASDLMGYDLITPNNLSLIVFDDFIDTQMYKDGSYSVTLPHTENDVTLIDENTLDEDATTILYTMNSGIFEDYASVQF